MTEKIRVELWGPGGQHGELVVQSRAEVHVTLAAWAAGIDCRPSEVDYRVNDGIRIMGETSAQACFVDVCGLPRSAGD